MWIRYTKEEYEELVNVSESQIWGIKILAKWIKKIIDANDEAESFRRGR